MLKVVYARNHGIGSYLIRAQSWFGPWSHCAVVTPDNTVIEATAWHGVVETSLDEFIVRQSKVLIVPIEGADAAQAIAFARSQVGKPYDWSAVRAFLFARDWQEDDAWVCSELVEAAIVAGGRSRYRINVNAVNPTLSFNTR